MNHDDTGRPDDLMEREVRDAYRALASERAPERLDRAVLAEAAAAAKPRSSPILRWRRPLAWAATIALSFALILEFTQTDPDLIVPAADQPAGSSDLDALDEAIPESAAGEPAAPAVMSEPAKRERMKELEIMSAPRAPADSKARGEAASGATSDVAVTAAPELEEAARESGRRVLEQRSLSTNSVRADQYVELDAGEPVCEAAVRASADDWRRCIEELAANGRTADASAEVEHFRRAFPDAPVPLLN